MDLPKSRALIARRNSGSVGRGGGAFSGRFFSPPCGVDSQVLEVGERDAGHERVSVQAGPGPSLEIVEAEFLLELLMRLLADPACLDRRSQASECGANREIAEIVFALSAAAPFPDEPDFLARQVAVARAAWSIGHPHAHSREARGERALGTSPPDDTPPVMSHQHIRSIP